MILMYIRIFNSYIFNVRSTSEDTKEEDTKYY